MHPYTHVHTNTRIHINCQANVAAVRTTEGVMSINYAGFLTNVSLHHLDANEMLNKGIANTKIGTVTVAC